MDCANDQALDSYVIEGLKHNVPLLYDIVDSKEFRTGELTTNFIKNKYGEDGFQSTLTDTASNNLAALVAVVHSATLKQKVPAAHPQHSIRQSSPHSVIRQRSTRLSSLLLLMIGCT